MDDQWKEFQKFTNMISGDDTRKKILAAAQEADGADPKKGKKGGKGKKKKR